MKDAFVGFLVQFMRMLYKSDFAPVHVELNRPEPELGPGPFIEYFAAPVDFGCKEIILHFDKKDMTEPLTGDNPELARYNDNIIIEHLARLEKNDAAAQVELDSFRLGRSLWKWWQRSST